MKKRIITVSREYGSGGRVIGRRIAEALNVKLYDKELIALAARESGFDLEYVKETGEYSTTGSLLFNLAIANLYGNFANMTGTADKLHFVQSKIISDIADREDCVIIGRSADYILRDRDDVLNVFIYADEAVRVKRAIEEYGLDEKNARKNLLKTDKGREAHYKRYTGNTWGLAHNYHLCLNSGFHGIDRCVEIILKAQA